MKQTVHQAFKHKACPRRLGGALHGAAVASLVVAMASIAFAQATPTTRGKPVTGAASSPVGAKPTGGKPVTATTTPPPAAQGSKSAQASKTDQGSKNDQAAKAETTPSTSETSLVAKLAAFVTDNAISVAIGAFLLIGAVVAWVLLRGKGGNAEDALSTQPAASKALTPAVARSPSNHGAKDDDGPRRVLVTPGIAKSQAIKVADVEREYALVVDEKDLAKPPVPEDIASARKTVDAKPLVELLEKQSFDAAYNWWEKELDGDRRVAAEPSAETHLSDHFLARGDLEKAKRLLEHHVATQPAQEIKSETYFNLAYIHFKGKTLVKSRRFFKLFVESEKNPAHVDRARKILGRLQKVHNLN